MIISVPGDLIPHIQNIKDVHTQTLEYPELDELDPIYAGGYVQALLLGPRQLFYPNRLQEDYYSDIDIYARNNTHLANIQDLLMSNMYNRLLHDTPRASTFELQNGLSVQVVKMSLGTPQEILDRFDFKNCAIAYHPLDAQFSMHNETVAAHLRHELDILNPWMLNPENLNNYMAVTQILRFRKYCERWNYTLSDRAFNILIETFKRIPDAEVKRGQLYTLNSDDIRYIASHNDNAWLLLQELLTNHPLWDPRFDTNNLFTPEAHPVNTFTPTITIGDNDVPF